MLTVLLVLQIIITTCLVVVILIQRNASDGMAGLASSGNSIMSGRASANFLTRTTAVFATVFIINSLLMAAIVSRSGKSNDSIVDDLQIEQKAPAAPIVDAPVLDKDNQIKNQPIDAGADSSKPNINKNSVNSNNKEKTKSPEKNKNSGNDKIQNKENNAPSAPRVE